MEKDLLQRIFRYPVPCHGCFDGPDHLVSHLLNQRDPVVVTQDLTLLGEIPLIGRHLAITLSVIGTLSSGEIPSLAIFLPEVDRYIVRGLEDHMNEILRSQFHPPTMVWNTIEMVWLKVPESVAAVLVGLQKALQLPPDGHSTVLLAPLSLVIRELSDHMLAARYRSLAEREFVAEQASITSRLLLTNLAVRSIFGRYNCNRVSCARAMGDVQPAAGWLPLYKGKIMISWLQLNDSFVPFSTSTNTRTVI
jgi:hypothetical protein